MSDLQLDNNRDLEQLVLQEDLSSAVALTHTEIQIGIKGDPSLRESAMVRSRYQSEIDRLFDQIEPVFEDLLLNHGIYRLFIGFNNSAIRTCSIFDPLREEIHDVAALNSEEYIQRHFPKIPYEEKNAVIRKWYDALYASDLVDYLPQHLQSLAVKRHASWRAMQQSEIRLVIGSLKVLRSLPEYYLRNLTVSTVQSVVRLQFNCDGTQVVHARDFEHFMQQNFLE